MSHLMPITLRPAPSLRAVLRATAFAAVLTVPAMAYAGTETVLYSFKGGADGSTPMAGLVMDSAGNLYGTTSTGGSANAGTVYELSPPAAGQTQWTEKVIYTFSGGVDGLEPLCSLVFDPQGNLYGTTRLGGNTAQGNVFELSPPVAGGAWTEKVIWSFDKLPRGVVPVAGLVRGPLGHLFGTTEYGGKPSQVINLSGVGTVFVLIPPTSPSTTWTERVIHKFDGDAGEGAYPVARLTRLVSGILFGTTSAENGKGVFELTPPTAKSPGWTETTLGGDIDGVNYNSSVAVSKDLTTYTPTYYGGQGYNGIASETINNPLFHAGFYTFGGTLGGHPDGGMLLVHGDVYGTTSAKGAGGYGVLYELKHPVAGSTTWHGKAIYSFSGGADGAAPVGDLLLDSSHNFYGVTQAGGTGGAGTVYRITP